MQKNKPVYEHIRRMPVYALLSIPPHQLGRLEKDIRHEVSRARQALRWIQGIRKLQKQKIGECHG